MSTRVTCSHFALCYLQKVRLDTAHAEFRKYLFLWTLYLPEVYLYLLLHLLVYPTVLQNTDPSI
jgi:hypothetical protein